MPSLVRPRLCVQCQDGAQGNRERRFHFRSHLFLVFLSGFLYERRDLREHTAQ
jgi:hypothetical protein